MIQAMYSGVSGMRAFKTQLDVIGNNIANINTVGFKGSRVTFQEALNQIQRGASAPSESQGGVNPLQLGLGVNIGSIDINQTQGSLQSTGKLTDAAIEGNGFFVLSSGDGLVYSRDGAFSVDSDSNLVNASGLPVLGWSADASGGVNTDLQIVSGSKLKIPIGQLSLARQTSEVSFGGNLNATSATDAEWKVSAPVYDSLGVSHEMSITFTKTAGESEWSYNIESTETVPGTLATGTIHFDENGKCDTDLIDITASLATPNGSADPLNFQVSFGKIGQLNGTNTVGATFQDGLPLGTLESFTVAKDGTISGMFTNGSVQTLGKLAMASFSNPSGLNKVGGNMLAASTNSGVAQIGLANVGGRGKISSGFLESSNVDLSNEFANMIIAQRGFQANSRIITVSDEVLQELVQLKR